MDSKQSPNLSGSEPAVSAAPQVPESGIPAFTTNDLPGPVQFFAPAAGKPRYWLHVLLFLITVLTTLMVGAQIQSNFSRGLTVLDCDTFVPLMWILERPARLFLGIPFCVTLMLILFSHEMGHYIYCRRHRVEATLPYFIPSPLFIGTFGAVIRIQAPIPNRKVLFDIGIAGPIAGMLMVLPATVIGMLYSKLMPIKPDDALDTPLFLRGAAALLHHGIQQPALLHLLPHPVLVAAWFGGLVTVLNLLPGGQLDGGHILYALTPRRHKRITTVVALALLGIGLFFWSGWILWGAILLYLRKHPEIMEIPKLNVGRRVLALVALLLFVVTFMFRPLPVSPSIATIISDQIHKHLRHR